MTKHEKEGDDSYKRKERRKRKGTQNTKRKIHRVRIVTKKDHMNKSFFTYFYKSETVFGFLFKCSFAD